MSQCQDLYDERERLEREWLAAKRAAHAAARARDNAGPGQWSRLSAVFEELSRRENRLHVAYMNAAMRFSSAYSGRAAA